MKIDEYVERSKKLRDEYDKNLGKLRGDFALSNSPVSVGDMVSDGHTIVKVDSIKYYMPLRADRPSCVYYGYKYTKKGVPYKSGERDSVYQKNMEISFPTK